MDLILNTPISEGTLSPGLRRAIINAIFAVTFSDDEYQCRADGLSTYFSEWYEDQCKQSIRQVSAATHREVLDAVALLRDPQEHQASTVEKIGQKNGTTNSNGKKVEASVILAARLLSMISIGEIDFCISPGRTVAWQQGPLFEAIRSEFPISKLDETDSLPKIFKAVNLERFAGIKVCWTSNLADHLSLEGDEVRLFHQISFLELHKESSRSAI